MILICTLGLLVTASIVWSAGTSSKQRAPKKRVQDTATESERLYQKGMVASVAENYDQAYEYFNRAYQKDAGNPDILNMLAFSQRKRGNLEEAFDYYEKALKLRPRFPQAREYDGPASG